MAKAQPKVASLRQLVEEAAQVGRQRAAFLADWREQHPTLNGWLQACLALAGLSDPDELLALRARIEAEAPRLHRLCAHVGRAWSRPISRDGQPPTDRPAPALDFEGTGSELELPAWVERQRLGLGVEQASAVAGVLAAELGRGWGWRGHVDEAGAILAGLAEQLAALQQRMSATPPAWDELELATDGRVLVVGTAVEALPHESLAARSADAGAVSALLPLAA
jgi:hypothetical protein